MITSLLALIIFAAVVIAVTRLNKKLTDTRARDAVRRDPFPRLATELGLTHVPHKSAASKDSISASGGRLSGDYKGRPVEIIMEGSARHEAPRLGFSSSFSYETERKIILHVSNPDHKKFRLMPKTDSLIGSPLKNAAADELFSFSGNVELPEEFLKFAAQLNWMDLELKGDTLILYDSFYDERKNLAKTHPVWRTEIATWDSLKAHDVRTILDRLSRLADYILGA